MCIFCKGTLNKGKTDYIENNKNLVILIRDVPCEKCGQCGEIYYDNDTVQVLEKALGKVQHISSEITLTVMDYGKNVA